VKLRVLDPLISILRRKLSLGFRSQGVGQNIGSWEHCDRLAAGKSPSTRASDNTARRVYKSFPTHQYWKPDG
jgi:hypothetical protein